MAPLKIVNQDGRQMAEFKSVGTRKHYWPLASAQERLEKAQRLLSEESGYLYANDRAILTAFVNHNELPYNGSLNLGEMQFRAGHFRSEKIPPIFQSNLESILQNGEHFPSVDYVLLQGAGMWEKKLAAKAARMNAERAGATTGLKSLFIPKADAHDVRKFAARAYDNGKINIHFVRDLSHRVRENASDKRAPQYESMQSVIVDYLHRELKAMIPEETKYESVYTPGEDLGFLYNKGMWHLRYSPQDREAIARAFAEGIKTRTMPRNAKTISRMQALFPQILEGVENYQEQDIRRKYAAAAAQDSFASVDPLIFYDPQYKDLAEDAIRRIEARIDSLMQSDRQAILLPLNEHGLETALRVPNYLLAAVPITDRIHRKRLEVVQAMSDEDFIARFPQHVMAPYGHRKAESVDAADSLHSYLQQRYRELSQTSSR